MVLCVSNVNLGACGFKWVLAHVKGRSIKNTTKTWHMTESKTNVLRILMVGTWLVGAAPNESCERVKRATAIFEAFFHCLSAFLFHIPRDIPHPHFSPTFLDSAALQYALQHSLISMLSKAFRWTRRTPSVSQHCDHNYGQEHCRGPGRAAPYGAVSLRSKRLRSSTVRFANYLNSW